MGKLAKRLQDILNEQDFCFDPEEMRAVERALGYLAACEDKIPFDRLDEAAALVKDWDEGRVHIDPPPAKEGDPQPDCFEDYGGSLWCLGYQRSENVDEPCDRCKRCWYCKNGDYADASPEAEAALGGGGDG